MTGVHKRVELSTTVNAIAMGQRTEPERPGQSAGGDGRGVPSAVQPPDPAPAAVAAADRLQAVIPPLVPQQQATHTTTKTATTPHQQGSLLPASHTSPIAGDIKEATAAARPPEEDGGDPHTASTARTTKLSVSPKMIFSDLYKSPKSPFTKLRGSVPHALPLSPDYDPDLVSKDKAKQKEAVRKFLAQKILNDWEFTWPPVLPPSSLPRSATTEIPGINDLGLPPAQDDEPAQKGGDGSEIAAGPPDNDEDEPKDEGEEADSESGAETDYSVVSEDHLHFRPRSEWTSDLSDDDEPAANPSPFRFDSPEAVGTVVQATVMARKRRRRKALRDEMAWNDGLACFEARRNAWTGAKTVRVKPKPSTPLSPVSPRRLFWRTHHRLDSSISQTATNANVNTLASPLSPTTTHTSQGTNSPPPSDLDTRSNASSTTKPTSGSAAGYADPSSRLYPVEILLPIPAPLLPPQNGMRASVTPSIYPSLYDKIVVHSLQPSCPVNLGDMVRACVVGWKRDGEWPPKSTMVAPLLPPTVAPTYLAVRTHRKANSSAAAARLEHARKGSSVTSGPSRRMSFGALLGRGEKGGEEQDKERRDSHHDEDGKGIRKSLQKVFSLGHHAAVAGEQ